ncbi:MAG: hypothetical protein H6Q54_564 [Deltaproteobacteria bacterium]|nr:hypothetical protein [Deltaproteobacteria bacterium]
MLVVAVYTKFIFSLDVPFFRHALILRIGFFSVNVDICGKKLKSHFQCIKIIIHDNSILHLELPYELLQILRKGSKM